MIYQGNNADVLANIADNTYTGILTDPPYGLSFMNKAWDYDVPDVQTFQELLRVTKSGGFMLCFAGSRTYHRMVCNIEDAGWIIKDTIMWLYGSGFPKSYAIGKAVDAKILMGGSNTRKLRAIEQKYGGDEYEIKVPRNGIKNEPETWSRKQYDNQTELGRMFGGYGTALKPAYEPICIAMKPNDGSNAENAINHGVAGLNIDECRIGREKRTYKGSGVSQMRYSDSAAGYTDGRGKDLEFSAEGRWPANVIHDGSAEVTNNLPEQAARFFYCAKASTNEKNAGLDDFEPQRNADREKEDGVGGDNPRNRTNTAKKNHHPTVKPLALMQYLARLLKMPVGTKLLDPYMGSGSTLIACALEGIDCDGIEMNEDYIKIAKARLAHYIEDGDSDSDSDHTQISLFEALND